MVRTSISILYRTASQNTVQVMSPRTPGLFTIVMVMLACWMQTASPVAAQDRVSNTVHNLSAGGPGTIRALFEGQVCVFCHAPHNTGGMRPLWNRKMPVSSYMIYESSTLDADSGQPTGASKLCLSCHDGTIALGSVLSRADQIRISGPDTIPAGLTNLDTDLSDDHPISFYYTAGLASSDLQLADPATLDPRVPLGPAGRLECTACHDPHNNSYGDFLVMPNEFGALCTQCHKMNGWTNSSHRSAATSVTGVQGVTWPFATVAANACRSCHRPHTAGGRERLLIFDNEEENCLSCHNGLAAASDIEAQLDKPSAHDPRRYLHKHDPVETFPTVSPHAECADCHNAHAVSAQGPVSGYIPIGSTLAKTPGRTLGGTPISEAQYEYEICFRCHSDAAVPSHNRIVRQGDTPNLRLEFDPTNVSYHPVAAPTSTTSISLQPGMVSGSMIRCTDCHNNDSGPRAGGSDPDGPHGSINDYLLERNYTVRDDTVESLFEYELCYKCHQQSSILANQSFSKHSLHITEENTPCSACHDPHGVSGVVGNLSDKTHLINFDINIVLPNPDNNGLEFRDLGTRAGSCTLLCHGEKHDNESYSALELGTLIAVPK